MEAIIAAVVTGIFAIVGNLIISGRNTKDLYTRLDKQSELADEKIRGEIAVVRTEMEELRLATQRHNNLIERTYHLEQAVAVHEEQIRVANHRISDLESA